MKILKSGKEYNYEDLKRLQCGTCRKKLWDKGQEIVHSTLIRCPNCGTAYSFESIRWKVLADLSEN